MSFCLNVHMHIILQNAGSSDKDAKKGDKTGGDNHVKKKRETLPHHHHQPDPGIDMKGKINSIIDVQ